MSKKKESEDQIVRSQKCFKKAKKVIPGGVNSPARAFSAVANDPLFIDRGEGAYIYDLDGNKYLDYVCSWGPLILGYNHPLIIKELEKQLSRGTSFGAPTELETELAELIIKAVPSIDQVRMVNSGTEATMSAIRLARGYTGRDKIVKMEGCYHGHGDSLLVKAGSGVSTLAISGSPGIPETIARETIVVPFNDIEVVEEVFKKYGKEIAAVILEPVAGNMGVIKPEANYLEGLRQITEDNDTLLIFDEVITGFRLSYGGAQELYGVKPDLTTLGKIIGGGLPVGAYGGKREIMEYIAPTGPVYQAGTLSGNPLAVTAGLTTLKLLKNSNIYVELEEKAAILEHGFMDNIAEIGLPAQISRCGSMFTLFFTKQELNNYQGVEKCNTEAFALYFNEMLADGIYLPPSQFEANFISKAVSSNDLQKTISVNYKALLKVKEKLYG